ncbi:MAG: phosphate acyltransferase PlsX [Oscillospiraceae bacterium]|nr:phosphate acyltransferase PlsX [Oscillospiraceae bacterium]
MRIIVDAMGGDNAPQAIVKGALQAQKELGAEIVLVGRKEAVEACLEAEKATVAQIVDAREIITMDDDPSTATRRKKDSSMAVALKMLHDGAGDAVVSAGSTGALLTGATLTVKRIRGIRRAALAPVLPNGGKGVMLIDCGANVECTPEYLLQFAYMGSFYSKRMLGCDEPRVGLLSNGTEEHKGGKLQHETFALLREADTQGRIRFIGNVEASQLLSGDVDVVVTDGFTGNVLLKGIEGTTKFMLKQLKGMFYRNLKNKLAALAIKSEFSGLKKALDPNEVGGTAMLGISRPVIKAHGSSDDRAVFNAIRQAMLFADSGIIDEITNNMDYMRLTQPAAAPEA